jgi:hypothetical protein
METLLRRIEGEIGVVETVRHLGRLDAKYVTRISDGQSVAISCRSDTATHQRGLSPGICPVDQACRAPFLEARRTMRATSHRRQGRCQPMEDNCGARLTGQSTLNGRSVLTATT